MINSNTCPICQQNAGVLSKFCGNCGYSFAHPIQTSVGVTCAKTFGLFTILMLISGSGISNYHKNKCDCMEGICEVLGGVACDNMCEGMNCDCSS